MSNIYWELPEIPIPDQAHINRSDGRVFLLGSRAGGKPTASRNVIGHATPETHMHANSLFKSIFPDLWKAHYGSNPPFMNEMNSGLDLIVLSILSRNGLLDILYQVYGSKYANAILDYAAYSVEYSSNVAMSFTEKMKNYILFSDELYSDTWYSNVFKNEISKKKNIGIWKL